MCQLDAESTSRAAQVKELSSRFFNVMMDAEDDDLWVKALLKAMDLYEHIGPQLKAFGQICAHLRKTTLVQEKSTTNAKKGFFKNLFRNLFALRV